MSLFNFTFLAPMALLGLLALAIPLYLHMRHKPRAEVYRFPAIDFLLRAQKKRKRRLHVEQILLMLFRFFIVCLLAFLFAKPYIEENFGTAAVGDNHPLVVLLDDSASMLAGPTNARFFDEARDRIAELIGQRDSAAPTRILLASNPGRLAEATNAGALRPLLAELKPTTIHSTLDEAYAAALDLVASQGWDGAVVHIFSDGSRNAWRELPETKPEGLDVIYHSLRDALPQFANVGIAQVSQSMGDSDAVEVEVFNSSTNAREVRLEAGGTDMPLIGHNMELQPHQSLTHFFALPDKVPGRLAVTLPGDDFDLDNEFIYVPRPNRMTRVLIVDGDSHPEPIKSESFFLKNALGFEDSEKLGYAFRVVTPVGLDAKAVTGADVIFVLNVGQPPTAELQAALAADQGLFIGMGDRMDFDRWNEFFRTLDLEMWEVKQFAEPQPVEIRAFDHPFFQPIDELTWTSYLASVGIRANRLISTGRSDAKIPLVMADGSPLLLTRELTAGRMMVWTSSMDADWSNFPIEFGYVPFVRQACSWLAGRDLENDYSSLTVDEVLARDLTDKLSLKYAPDVYANLDHHGPKPGVYTTISEARTHFVSVTLDPAELDFTGFAKHDDDAADAASALAAIGFRSYHRTDLAPSVQWLLFLLLLVETFVAARITLSWGAR